MNYCIVAFGIMLFIAGLTWIFDGRKNYRGPRLDVQGLIEGRIEGMETLAVHDKAAEGSKTDLGGP